MFTEEPAWPWEKVTVNTSDLQFWVDLRVLVIQNSNKTIKNIFELNELRELFWFYWLFLFFIKVFLALKRPEMQIRVWACNENSIHSIFSLFLTLSEQMETYFWFWLRLVIIMQIIADWLVRIIVKLYSPCSRIFLSFDESDPLSGRLASQVATSRREESCDGAELRYCYLLWNSQSGVSPQQWSASTCYFL